MGFFVKAAVQALPAAASLGSQNTRSAESASPLSRALVQLVQEGVPSEATIAAAGRDSWPAYLAAAAVLRDSGILRDADAARLESALQLAELLEPLHGKLSTIRHFNTSVFKGLPERFQVTRYHSLIVEDIPDELIVNATSDDGHVMGFRHREHPIEGVQFHPESILSEHGHAMLKNFLSGAK